MERLIEERVHERVNAILEARGLEPLSPEACARLLDESRQLSWPCTDGMPPL